MANKPSTCGRGSSAYVPLAARPGKLHLSEAECSICYSLLIEPVTVPCKHSFCKKCFDKHVSETSIVCPNCRQRLSIWLRKATKENTLVDQRLWQRIQDEFPDKVNERLADIGKEEDSSQSLENPLLSASEGSGNEDSLFVRDGEFNTEPGHILRELQQILEPHQRDLLTQREKEEAASMSLAKQLQEEEEERRRIMEEQTLEEDRKLAERLQKQLNDEEQARTPMLSRRKTDFPAQIPHVKQEKQMDKPSRKRKRKSELQNEPSGERKIQTKITPFTLPASQSSGDSGVALSSPGFTMEVSTSTAACRFTSKSLFASTNQQPNNAGAHAIKNEAMFSDDDESEPGMGISSAIASPEKDCELNAKSSTPKSILRSQLLLSSFKSRLEDVGVGKFRVHETDDDVVFVQEIVKKTPKKEILTPSPTNQMGLNIYAQGRPNGIITEPVAVDESQSLLVASSLTPPSEGSRPLHESALQEEALLIQTPMTSQDSKGILTSPVILCMKKPDGSTNQTALDGYGKQNISVLHEKELSIEMSTTAKNPKEELKSPKKSDGSANRTVLEIDYDSPQTATELQEEKLPIETPRASQESDEEIQSPVILFMKKSDGSVNRTVLEINNYVLRTDPELPEDNLSMETPRGSQESEEEIQSPVILFVKKSDGSAAQTVLGSLNVSQEFPGTSFSDVGNVSTSQSQLESENRSFSVDDDDLEIIPDSRPPSPSSLEYDSSEEGAKFVDSFLEYKALEDKRKQEEEDRKFALTLQRHLNLGLQDRGKDKAEPYSLRSWAKGKK